MNFTFRSLLLIILLGFIPKFIFKNLQRNLIEKRLASVINFDCTNYDDTKFSMEEYYEKKHKIINPRSWNLNRMEDLINNRSEPINKNLSLYDFEEININNRKFYPTKRIFKNDKKKNEIKNKENNENLSVAAYSNQNLNIDSVKNNSIDKNLIFTSNNEYWDKFMLPEKAQIYCNYITKRNNNINDLLKNDLMNNDILNFKFPEKFKGN